MSQSFNPGDRVESTAKVGWIEPGYRFRVCARHPGGEIELYGEDGTWSPENFKPADPAKAPPPLFPDAGEQEEAKSVTIKIDHAMISASLQGETMVNCQLSSLTAHEVLLTHIAYFVSEGEGKNLMAEADHMLAIAEGARSAGALYAYTPNDRVKEIIMDMSVYESFMAQGGHTLFGGYAAAIQEAQVAEENFANAGRDTTLVIFVPDAVTQEPDLD